MAKIAVENAAYAFDKLYSYLLPGELAGALPGSRVTVPFGGGNRSRTGLIVALDQVADRDKLKPVKALVDREPLLDGEDLMLLRYLKEHTFCTWFDALRLLIPAGIGIVYKTVYRVGSLDPTMALTPQQTDMVDWVRTRRAGAEQSKLCEAFGIDPGSPVLLSLLESGALIRSEETGRKIQDERVCMVRLSADYRPERLTPKQKLAAAFLEETEAASLKEICYYAGVTRAVVDNMKKSGQVDYYDAVRYRSPFAEESVEQEGSAVLSPSQQAAFEELRQLTDGAEARTALLYGVTGSGKTQVFLRLIEEVIQGGRSALVLVPEISLTAQAVDSFRRRFGGQVAVLHSGLSLGERMDEWKRIRAGKAGVVVGTRSAVFAPLNNLGLIVMDEEQEHTYQSDKSPRFHARDVALRRCAWHGALLLLASATPSIESYYHAKQGKYHLVNLEERYNQQGLPDVYTVDMRDSENLSQSPSFSQLLLEEIRYNLERGEQSILLLNRRGYATVIKCSSCGTAADCPNCSVAMTYHSENDSLICHYCGYARHRADTCEHCGSKLMRYAGTGTQKLEQELTALFPDARVLRVDMDTTMAKFSHEKLFAAFAAHEYDIMVGTQMVAKGLNFPDVTLVGVLCADQSLYAADFRSYERSFSLLTQVVGRCGRGQRLGRAFVQTFSPDNPVIQLAAAQDYPAFYAQEIVSRKLHLYPPFCTMAGIGFVGESLKEVQDWSKKYLDRFRAVASEQYGSLPIRLLGPAPSEVVRVAGKYRYKIILKCRNSPTLRQLLADMLAWFYGQCKTVSVFVDMHGGRL